MARDVDIASDRPAHGEIVITPEMIEAGLDALYSFPITEPFESEMRDAVAAVYRAMDAVARNTRKLDHVLGSKA